MNMEKKPTWLNISSYYTDLYTIKETNYNNILPGIYVSLHACAKAIYEDMNMTSPTMAQIIEIANRLNEDGEYESEQGNLYTVWSNPVWDIVRG